MPSYDYPFNERIRTLLRLEDLFVKVTHNIDSSHEYNHHGALISMFQILDVIDRAELKADLLQELDRQKMVLNSLLGNPSIDEELVKGLVGDIETTTQALRNNQTKLGQTLRDNEWLMSIKQRTGIPGGVCEFDLPSYHYWLGLNENRRKTDLIEWLQPLMPIFDALRIILQILRGSGNTVQLLAVNGVYQQMLGGSKPAQMLRLDVPDDVICFPEVSANKYAINIRFSSLGHMQKPRQCEMDVNFSLTLCNL